MFKTTFNFLQKKIKNNIVIWLYCFIIVFIFTACRESYTPKRSGYFRIDFPTQKIYTNYDCDVCPFTFEYPTYGYIKKDSNNIQELHEHPCWMNLVFSDYNAKIYLSYTKIDAQNPIDKLIKDSYKLTFKHTVKADYIDETPVAGRNPKVHGVLYDVGGNAASGVQFFITDSTHNFLRGSLYFYAPPNADSLAPAITYFRKDVEHIIETLKWK